MLNAAELKAIENLIVGQIINLRIQASQDDSNENSRYRVIVEIENLTSALAKIKLTSEK